MIYRQIRHVMALAMLLGFSEIGVCRADSIYYLTPELNGSLTVLKRMDTSTGLTDIVSASLPLQPLGYLNNSAVYIESDGSIFFTDGTSMWSVANDGEEATHLFSAPGVVAFDKPGRIPALQRGTVDKFVLKYSRYEYVAYPSTNVEPCIYILDKALETNTKTDFIAEPQDVDKITGVIRGLYNVKETSAVTAPVFADWNISTDVRTDLYSIPALFAGSGELINKVSVLNPDRLIVSLVIVQYFGAPIPSSSVKQVSHSSGNITVSDFSLTGRRHAETYFTNGSEVVYRDGDDMVRYNVDTGTETGRLEIGSPMSYSVSGNRVTFFYPAMAVSAPAGRVIDRVRTLSMARDLSNTAESFINVLQGGEANQYIRGDGPPFIAASNVLLSKDETTVFLIGDGGLMAVNVATGDRSIVTSTPVELLSTPSLGTTQVLGRNQRPPSEAGYSGHC